MTATALARKFRLRAEISTGVFALMAGVSALDFPPINPNMVNSSSYENEGWTTNEPTEFSWMTKATAWRRITGGSVYDPCQEFLRLKAFGQFGDQSRAHVQILDKNGGVEAFDGYAYVTYTRGNSGVQDLESADFILTGDGPLAIIANPYAGSLVPQLVSAAPSGKGAGQAVTLFGNFLDTTTGITVNGVALAAGTFLISSANQITIVLPAGTAGATPIIVTNTAGVGNTLSYTRVA
jgi:hypothetical protein